MKGCPPFIASRKFICRFFDSLRVLWIQKYPRRMDSVLFFFVIKSA